ncbi:Peptidase S8, subtilisin-related [Parasponia andersonii]|uniref:Peptidase S8, subtilisin-related n=1 Tax=Parasponia andersonii TaxID=3476 RepID=A0A2P5BZN2_PARAD|nr:Peptidase S8, subtilisin-related [Parasponia andersonii]
MDDVFCLPGTLNPEDVSGKIVVCIRGENSKVEISLGVKEAVAAFSSRGPNTRTPEILKPDVLAPGVNILAAWTGAAGPTGLGEDKRRISFNIKSGTSMSCPHVSGLAALIKSMQKWSPAAIRSALMTTAYYTYKNGKTIQDIVTRTPATPFDYGAGHVDRVAALDPGLVYDITVEDYIRFLCASNYTKEQIKTVTKRNFNCNNGKKKYSVGDLNDLSFAVPLKAASDEDGGTNRSTTVTYTRTLTNVGTSPARYRVKVSKVDAVKISV